MNKVRKRSAEKVHKGSFRPNDTVPVKLMIAERFRIDQSSSLTFYVRSGSNVNDSLVITSVHDRRHTVSRFSSFGVVLFHRLLGNFSGMFWGSSGKFVANLNLSRISKGREEGKDRIGLNIIT